MAITRQENIPYLNNANYYYIVLTQFPTRPPYKIKAGYFAKLCKEAKATKMGVSQVITY
jgi:hypothetical protein